jgi:iron complex transport system substrate-binding protein
VAAIRACGQALGREQVAADLVERVERTRERIRRQARILKRPRVLFVYGYEPFIVAGPGSFADELLRDAGAINAAERATSPYPVYSVESAIRARADVVVSAVEAHVGGGEKLQSLPGLKEARWVRLPSLDLLHPGPRLAEGLDELFQLLHPELGTDAGK